jgi:hypothetical protein
VLVTLMVLQPVLSTGANATPSLNAEAHPMLKQASDFRYVATRTCE